MLSIQNAVDASTLAAIRPTGWDAPQSVRSGVADILRTVRERGDEALVEYTRRFDFEKFSQSDIRVKVPPLDQTRAELPGDVARALEIGAHRIGDFHARQLPHDLEYTAADGTYYAFKYQPLRAIGAYVPGGTAVLPSSVLMNVIPAKVAGVARVAVFTPPGRDGSIASAILFACALCGVDEVYACGGAQAIAAGAYGTASVARVDKIVGPGNIWVTEAKRQVFGTCGIDGLAGPSEVLVVTDATASAENAVAELLAQAEHDPLARVAIVAPSAEFLQQCAQHLAEYRAERGAIVERVLQRGATLILASTREQTLQVIEAFAPEHLALLVEDPRSWIDDIRNAGAIFCGAQTPVAWGDYIAGTNHVLPTAGAARFSSGLRTADFLRSFSVLENSTVRAREDAPLVAAIARYEGLPQHALTAERVT